MANPTLALLAKSPYHLKYKLTSDSTDNAGNVERTQNGTPGLVNDAAAGPLKTALAKPVTSAQWASLIGNVNGAAGYTEPVISVYITPEPVVGGQAVACGAALLTNESVNVLEASIAGGAGAQRTAIIEIRYNHTLDR